MVVSYVVDVSRSSSAKGLWLYGVVVVGVGRDL